MSWISILVAIFSSPAVQAALQQLWTWVLNRLEQRFGPPNTTSKQAFVTDLGDRMAQASSMVPWYRFGKRALIQRMADHTMARVDDVWASVSTNKPITPSVGFNPNE